MSYNNTPKIWSYLSTNYSDVGVVYVNVYGFIPNTPQYINVTTLTITMLDTCKNVAIPEMSD